MRTLAIVIGVVLLMTTMSCEEIKEQQKKKKRNLRAEIKKEQIGKYCSYKQVSYLLDTLRLHYSVDYEGVINSDLQAIDDFELQDISFNPKVSLYYIHLEAGFISNLFCTLSCSPDLYKKLRTIFGPSKPIDNHMWSINNDQPDVLLLVKMKRFRKVQFQLSCETDIEESGPSSYLEVDAGDKQIGFGSLQEIHQFDLPE